MTGNIVDCAEAVLIKDASNIKNDNEEMLLATLLATLLEVRELVAGYEPWKKFNNGS